MSRKPITPLQIFKVLISILLYITASGAWLLFAARDLISSSSDIDVAAAFFGTRSGSLRAPACSCSSPRRSLAINKIHSHNSQLFGGWPGGNMSTNRYDSRTADKFVVRLPDGLRTDIEAAANASDRSMNSVFVQAVRQYLDGQNRQQVLLDVLVMAASETTGIPAVLESMHIDDRVRLYGQRVTETDKSMESLP